MSLLSEFAHVAAARPNQIAIITEKSQLTYEDLLGLVQLFDIELTTRGVRTGQTLVLDSVRAEFCIAMSLLLSLRGLNVAFASTKNALAAGMEFDRVLATQPTDLVDPDRQIIIEPDWFTPLGTFPAPDYRGHTGIEGAFIAQSSGSTGKPKFVRSIESERLRNARRGAGFQGVSLGSRRFCSTLSASAGWSITANLATLLAGGSVLSLGAQRDKIASFIDLYRVDAMVTTPAIISQLATLPNASQFLASLRDVRIGGAMVSPALISAFRRISDARLHVGYGAAEIGTIFMSVLAPNDPVKPGYVGNPVRDDLEIDFFAPDLSPLANSKEGVVGIRLTDPAMRRVYLSDSGDSNSGLIDDYFFPGDIMRKEDDGYYYVGRVKNIINVSGNKFALETIGLELEHRFPGFRCVPLIMTDEHGIEGLAVIYCAAATIDAAELETAIADKFCGLRVLRAIRVEQFPMTQTGKIDVEALRDQHLSD